MAQVSIKQTVNAYDVEKDGVFVGTVYKTFRHGHVYWRISGRKSLYSTRKAAVNELVQETNYSESFERRK